MKKIGFIIIILCTLCLQHILAQQKGTKIESSDDFIFHFRMNKHLLDKGYMNNSIILQKLDSLLGNEKIIERLDSIEVVASSSPEGMLKHNRWLARERAKAIKGYIVWKYPHINQWSIHIASVDEGWNGLRKLVEADHKVPDREKVLVLIDTDVNHATKVWRLKQIQQGASWRYIANNCLKQLRSGAACVTLFQKEEEVVAKVIEPEEVKVVVEKELEVIVEKEPEIVVVKPVEPKVEVVTKPLLITKPLFAIKTNLLYDAVSALNVEIEVPIGQRWSVSGELITPWWRKSKSDWTMQVLAGDAAVKYWFGDREKKKVLTGWNLGLYGGGGKYDLQLFDKHGSQGDFFSVGLQGGYAHSIARNLRLEYSFGVGFMRSQYKEYDKHTDTKYGDIKVFEYPWEVKQRDWIGPTNFKVSLVWLLNYKTTKKGDKR